MRAIVVERFGGPEVLELKQVADPLPGPGEVLVRVRAIGINPVETYIRTGTYAMKPELPWTPGTDAAGVVEAVGEGVDSVSVGQRVYTAKTLSGAYAELALCEASQVHTLPEAISFSQGAALGIPYATAYRALFQRGLAMRGETVLVHGGSGGVGIATIQFATAAGLRVLATAGSGEGRKLCEQHGAAAVFDHHQAGHLEQVQQATDGRGVDLVIEMLANANLGRDLPVLARGGRVVVVGSRGTVEINPRDLMAREAAVLGMVLFNASKEELGQAHRAIVDGLKAGSLNPVINQELSLEQAPKAHGLVMAPGAGGKIVLVP